MFMVMNKGKFVFGAIAFGASMYFYGTDPLISLALLFVAGLVIYFVE